VDELLPYTKEARIFNKNTFGYINLGEYIYEQGFDRVDFVGVCTGICVISNAMLAKAYSPETPVYVHADLCACVTRDSHETALSAMRCCQIDVI
jgi:nicotinamidase-related amidase